MKLTPLEIRKQEFRKAIRGFDPIEVQTFLEMVAEEYEKVLEENKSMNQRLIELQTKLQDYQETEKTLRETLLNVQEVKKQSEESSRRQADLIIKEAELKALEIMENARKQARQMREEVNWLKSQKESFINRLRHILISQIELLSVMEIDDAIPEEAKSFLKTVKNKKISQLKTAEEQLPQETPETPEISSDMSADAQSGIELAESEENEAPEEQVLPGQQQEGLAQSDKVPTTEEKKKEKEITDEDINEFFKKGIQIDELIKTLSKKDKDK